MKTIKVIMDNSSIECTIEESKANDLYKNLANQILEQSTNMNTPKKPIQEIEKEIEEPKIIIDKQVNNVLSKERFNTILVSFKCENCGAFTSKNIEAKPNDTNIYETCFKCGSMNIIEKIIKTNVKCRGCNKGFYLYCDSKMKEVNCSKCNTKTPIEYMKHKKEFISK